MSLTLRRWAPVVFFSLAPFAWFYASNLHEPIRLGDLFAYALATALGTCTLTGLSEVLFRTRSYRVSSIVAAATLLFFSYRSLTESAVPAGLSKDTELVVYAILCLALLAVTTRWGARPSFHLFLTAFAAANLAVALSIGVARSANSLESPEVLALPIPAEDVWSGTALRRPNIYWIVVDSYPNRRELLDYYGFDNAPFIESLVRRGFNVTDESYANFSTTLLSIPSTLDMAYVFDEEDPVYEINRNGAWQRLPGKTHRGVNAAISGDNRTVSLLRQQGYAYVHFSGGTFLITRCQGHEDVCLEATPATFSDLQYRLLSLTPLWDLLARSPTLRKTLHPRRQAASGTGIVELESQLGASQLPQPFFLYAHIASPHRPYANDALCNLLPLDFDRRGNRHFLEQLSCVNRHLEQLLDSIQNRDPEAIIWLSSDHGPRLSIRKGSSIFSLSKKQVRESLGVLQAFRLPPDCQDPIPKNITPINGMRLIFACLSKEEPRWLPDRHYIARPDAPERGRIRRVQID